MLIRCQEKSAVSNYGFVDDLAGCRVKLEDIGNFSSGSKHVRKADPIVGDGR
jgi:hypothetical protein